MESGSEDVIYHYNERALTRGGLQAGEMPTEDSIERSGGCQI